MTLLLRPTRLTVARSMVLIMTMVTAIIACGAASAAERVYKWTDENGVVHFSASPPPNQKTERIKVPSAPPAQPADTATDDAPQGELYAESEPPDNSGVEERNRQVQCQKGRNMITQIEPRPRVFRVAEDGTRTYLDDDERMRLLEEARSLIAEHCNS